MDLHAAISIRHSVHRFGAAPLDPSVVQSIVELARRADPLAGRPVEVVLAGPDQVKGSSAPYHLLAFTTQDDAGFASAGYVLQLADLTLQAQGLGSHWIGLAGPKAKRPDFTVLLAFGPTDEPPRAEADASRLPLDRISAQDNPVARAVRLAPSGVNDQPWLLEFSDKLVRLVHQPRGAMSLVLAKKMDKISLGIAARHAAVALEHEGCQVSGPTAACTEAGRFAIDLAYR
ncbi:MAG: hypothetical protein LBI84_07815 [Propionibacteriaceae bacterium]|jgi:hypothetical protein|nr:hypothetical protein [Propionibacteriaceae bacterium]